VISTGKDIFGEYSAGNAAVFHRGFLTLGRQFLLVCMLFSRYNGNRKSAREERRHESGHKKSSTGSGGIYPVAGAEKPAVGKAAGEAAVSKRTAGEDAQADVWTVQ